VKLRAIWTFSQETAGPVLPWWLRLLRRLPCIGRRFQRVRSYEEAMDRVAKKMAEEMAAEVDREILSRFTPRVIRGGKN
jgi:hypothetical protein